MILWIIYDIRQIETAEFARPSYVLKVKKHLKKDY